MMCKYLFFGLLPIRTLRTHRLINRDGVDNGFDKAQYDQLVARGKEKKVAITACMRKFLTILNAMMRGQQPFRTPQFP